jgi:hypothetical protein
MNDKEFIIAAFTELVAPGCEVVLKPGDKSAPPVRIWRDMDGTAHQADLDVPSRSCDEAIRRTVPLIAFELSQIAGNADLHNKLAGSADLHNKLAEAMLTTCVEPIIDAGGSPQDIFVLLESVVTGVVLLVTGISKSPEGLPTIERQRNAVDLLMSGVKIRLAHLKRKEIHAVSG